MRCYTFLLCFLSAPIVALLTRHKAICVFHIFLFHFHLKIFFSPLLIGCRLVNLPVL
uniref:Uncharacterized protein n=1 Tax=Arundo donax TaxID=35708 RepID=A0A0A9H9V1_ARUDO